MKWFNVLAVTTVAFVAPHADAQEITREQLCDTVAQNLIKFAQEIPKIPNAFEATYSSLSPEDQTRFAMVRENGIKLAAISKEYKNSFMKACFSD